MKKAVPADRQDDLKTAKKSVEELLKLLDFEAVVEISEDKENQIIKIKCETEEPGVLIGHHGETLSALQLVLGIMVNKKLGGEWKRIVVDVGDYREKREETLRRMALTSAQKAYFSGEPVVFSFLSPWERRTIHLALKDDSRVETCSEGEGEERKLVIKPRKTE